ncbi:MAG TPA: alginate lyase family protein [Acidobacteriaceae bacterium]|nr:alginate lyase family protein [Acidobacteriaceae bacterium]
MNRREFLAASAAAVWSLQSSGQPDSHFTTVDVAKIDRSRILSAADRYLNEQPKTITSIRTTRSEGGPHDYFSEGDYWWPDPKNPNGPYIRRDGMSNPANFNDHRELLIRLSLQVPALTAAWMITKKALYAAKAADHLRAWFVDPNTRMNPNLQYAQAIHGITPGRGTGIIDTLHLVEVARSASWLEHSGALKPGEIDAVRRWFTDYTTWMTTSKNGLEEKAAKNNHGTCWVAQVAEFACFTHDDSKVAECRDLFRSKLVPDQIAPDGRLPLELARTKPYSYSLFDMDALSTICQIASIPGDNLWTFTTPDGRGIRKTINFMFPFIKDKSKWPFPHDVEYFDDLPVRQPSLLFAGLAYKDSAYIALWRTLNPDPTVPEIIRNFPIRQPVLWVREPA